MVDVVPITSEIFPAIYKAFLHDDDPLSTESDWREVFDYRWTTDEGHCGYALMDGSRAVGMIGMVFANRVLGGQPHKVCNLHTWWVHDDYRGHSLALLRPLLRMQDYTVAHFMPCDKVRAISKRLGFDDISTQLRVHLPLLGRRSNRVSPTLTTDPDEIVSKLDDANAQLLNDHRPYRCHHMLVEHNGHRCYLIYNVVIRHRLPYVHILYVSNPDLFGEVEPAIRSDLLSRHRVWFVATDTRMLQSLSFPRTMNFWAPAKGLVRTAALKPSEIDYLYSDVAFLGLTTLPDLSHEVSKLLTRRRTFKSDGSFNPPKRSHLSHTAVQ